MDQITRTDPPLAASEKEMLEAFLDYHRATLVQKVSGVSDEALRRKPTVSSLSLLGLVKHLAYVELWWFRKVFANEDVYDPGENDPDYDFRIESDETTAGILALYEAEVAHARQILAENSLDEHAKRPGREGFTLRWILIHMLEETARHNGHADILREAIDGVTGE